MAGNYLLKLNGEERLDYEFNKPEHMEEIRILTELSKRDGWELKRLIDCCITIHRGKGSSIYTFEGIPILKVRNLHNEYIDWNTEFVLRDWFNKNKKKVRAKKRDLLLASTGVGTIGKVDILNDEKDVAIDSHITIIRLKKDHNPKYILYFLRSKFGISQIERFTTGCTGQTELNYRCIEDFNILIPKNKNKQDEIVKKVEKYIEKANISFEKFKNSVVKLKNIMSNTCLIKEKQFPTHFIIPEKKLNDRFDCYFHHPEREYINKELQNINKSKIKIIKGSCLDITKPINKKYFDSNKTKIFKYLNIGNTEKELGDIKNLDEDILLNLPSRARLRVKNNDILQPRPIGSTEGIVIVSGELDDQLASTGFIQIRPKNYEDALILWVALKSSIVQKQMFYLQSGSIQPEITPTNFKKYLLIPYPKNNVKKEIIEEMKKDIKDAREGIKKYKDSKRKAQEIFLELIGFNNKI